MSNVFNFYNRISGARLLTKNQLTAKTLSADNISDRANKGKEDDDIYSELDDCDFLFYSDENEDLMREEVYNDINNKVELFSELKDAIEKFCDEAITPDDSGKYFSVNISEDIDKMTKDILEESIQKVSEFIGFNSHIEAWRTFYEWSIFGKVAYIIEYKFQTKKEIEAQKNKVISDIRLKKVKLNESATTPKDAKAINEEISWLKKHRDKWENLSAFESFKKNDQDEELIATDIRAIKKVNFLQLVKQRSKETNKTYYDFNGNQYSENEVVIINYSHVSGNHLPIRRMGTPVNIAKKVSYAHRLIRNYNILNRMEITAVSWTILNAMYRQVTIIPITTKVSSKAKEAISKVRNKYLDNFSVDHDGNVRLNGDKTFNTMKHITLGERNGSKPEVSTVKWDGFEYPIEIVKYFRNRFMDDTRLPYSRFDKEGNSGGLSIYKAEGIPFAESSFYNYMSRVLHQFSEVIRKPAVLLTNIKDPKTTLIKGLGNKMLFNWESMNHYYDARRAERETKILSDIDQMLRFVDGEGQQIFPTKYLFVNKYKMMTEKEWDEMELLKGKQVKNDEDDDNGGSISDMLDEPLDDEDSLDDDEPVEPDPVLDGF